MVAAVRFDNSAGVKATVVALDCPVPLQVNAVSSHRPHSRSAEFARNQSLAKRTWEPIFKNIIYAGPYEPELDSEKTHFVEAENFPAIQTLVKVAAGQSGVTAILNADIAVSPRIRNIEQRMFISPLLCASSRRWHFDPANPNFEAAQLLETDRGRDIFIAKQSVWKHVSEIIPPHYRIGHQQWDAWMSDLFRDGYAGRWSDFTASKCVFHPHHGDRQMPYAESIVEGQAV